MRHVVVMAGTGAIGLVAVFLVDLINLFYISQLGEQAIAAAVGFAGVVGFFHTSICIGLMIGITATVSRRIGAGDTAQARRLATHSLLLMAVIAAVLALATVALLQALRPGLRQPQANLLQLRAQEALASLQEQLAAQAPLPAGAAASLETQWSNWLATLALHWPQARASREVAADGTGWRVTLQWPAPATGLSAERVWLALPTVRGAAP